MPTIVCEECGTVQTASIFDPDPHCQECGAAEFHSPEDDCRGARDTQPEQPPGRGPSSDSTMAWEYQCPVDGCEFSSTANDEKQLIEDAQQHVGDKHGNMPTREEVEQQIVGPG